MHQRKNSPAALLKLLFAAAVVASVAWLALPAVFGAGMLAAGTLRVALMVVGIALLALAAFVLLLHLAQRLRERTEYLEPPLEMSTLTFPPAPRVERPRLDRAKEAQRA